MLKVIGSKNCSRCTMLKTILSNKGKEYSYLDLEELDNETQNTLSKLAEESGLKSLPYILQDNKLLTMQEVI